MGGIQILTLFCFYSFLQTTLVYRMLKPSKRDSSKEGTASDSEEEDVAVHFFHNPAADDDNNTDASDFSRRKVVDALQRFFRGLRNSGITKRLQLISRA